MGKSQKKTGKGRIDKYYKLAKEQGYRARSAFKLIQLNKKFEFLESARCVIDLCAAPGGWLQVASKYMPPSSLIIGVDLVPIRPIPHVTTFAADITGAKCRQLLRSHMKDWKADVVLHDGAPNVGSAWVQDAFSQSELVLSSLKLAVEFLVKGGTFVTKVFRSQDYNNLLWVFGQLFTKVEATKPPSSRNVSAEIFVVCTGFLAPQHIDPKFLDPKHVFKDVAALPPAPIITTSPSGVPVTVLTPAATNVFQPGKKRRHRDGYADGDYTLFKSGPASDFIRTFDPITFLGSYNKISFTTDEEKAWLAHELTTTDIRANVEDLKVLGKSDFKALLKWRLALREELGIDKKEKAADELTETVEVTTEPVDEEQEIQEELERLNAEVSGRTKRERRKKNEKRTKTIQRMQLSMTAPMDIGQEFADTQLDAGEEMFDLGEAEKRGMRHADDASSSSSEDEAEEEEDELLDSDEERERKTQQLEGALDGMYDTYKRRMAERDAKWRAREAREKDNKNAAWSGIRKDSDDSSDGGDSDGEGVSARKIAARIAANTEDNDDASEDGGWDVVQAAKSRNDVDSDSDSDSSDEEADEEVEPLPSKKKRKGLDGSATLITSLDDGKSVVKPSKAAQVWFSQDVFKGLGNIDDIEDEDTDDAEATDDESSTLESDGDEDEQSVQEDDEDEDDFEIVPQAPDADDVMWDVEDEDEDRQKAKTIRKTGLTTAEAITLAQQLVNRQTTKTHLINDGFNRYSLNSKDDLPDWFLDDERKYYKPNIPITKEAVAMLRAKQRALDARPIKKVAEAKARKKMRSVQRLEKAVKKAEGVTQNPDMSERDKAGAVEKLMRKGLSSAKAKKSEIKVVVARGSAKGLKGRPKGVKGRYQMVDSRGKKELRAKKRTEKANKKRKRA